MSASPHPLVSIVIPVLNDSVRLQACLQAIEKQTYASNCYEVIVVDNGSDESHDTAGVVAQFPCTRMGFEPYASSFAARNKGVTLARGEVIALIDADCLPDPDWLEKGTQRLLAVPNCGLVGGRIDIYFQDPQRPTPVELYESLTAFPQQQLIEKQRFAATANVFTFKAIFEQVGGFEPCLKSSGDIEWGQRVAAAGYRLAYADKARVAHPARSTFAQLYQRSIRLAGGDYDLYHYRVSSWVRQQWNYSQLLFFSLVPPLEFVVRTLFDSRLKGIAPKLQVSAVIVFVRYVSAWELLRLKFGGVSTRE